VGEVENIVELVGLEVGYRQEIALHGRYGDEGDVGIVAPSW
jgi:hypothetical protein